MSAGVIRTPRMRAELAGARGADLGTEPPLARSGGREQPDRRSVSLRWLSGTVLTGLFGAGLIGSAIYVSVDGQFTFAEHAERASLAQLRSADTPAEGERSSRRGDRLFTAADIVSAKQTFRTPTTIRVGDREVIKAKPFVRVSTNLALSSLGYADDIPAFNPLKLYAADPAQIDKTPAEAEPAADDAEVSVRKVQLIDYSGAPDSGDVLSQEQVDAQVAELHKVAASATPGLPISSQTMLTRALMAPRMQGEEVTPVEDTTFSSLQVTFVPENVSTQDRQLRPGPKEGGPEEKIVTIRHGETFEQTLKANGASPFEASSILKALAARFKEQPPREGERLRLLFGLSSDPRRPTQLLRLVLYDGETPTAIAAINDRNDFVSVAPPQAETAQPADDSDEEDGDRLSLFQSLYETGMKHDIPRAVVDQVVKIAFYDVDLQRRVTGGDSFEVFYSEDEENENRPDLLRASLTVGGQTRNYYRFQLGEDGVVDFFDESGRSNRKFLVRKPIAAGEMRSTFGMRYHPILRYTRMHTGVDWANKIGTPIFAAGDGRIRKAEWDSGYGRRVEIEHPYNFVTTYSHMSAFARGIQPGARVRQGQVIGYLGNSGLSTGPHLHYEVLINENFVDPLSVKVPRNRELDNAQVAAFKREKDRIDELIAKAPAATRLAGAR
jgi:murein DD-endopeptidase MepM/ murein hydrolase activator NlpD